MSKEIKDLINSIKNGKVENSILPETKPVEIVKPIESSLNKKEEDAIEEAQIITEKVIVQQEDAKKEKFESKRVKVKTVKQNVQTPRQDNKSVAKNLSNDFFASLSETEFSFEQKSVSNIDDRIYEIFMLLKRKKRVKNIALIINTILSNYIEENKEDIKNILLNNQI